MVYFVGSICYFDGGGWKRRRNEEEDEEVGSGTYHGEEEEEEGEEERESRKKTKEDPTPLWKYVTRQAKTRGGGTTKFVCPHCNKTYTGSYTCVRRHLCGHMPCDERKIVGVSVCPNVVST